MKLRYYQAPAAKAVIDYIKKNPGKHPVVAMPTGAGKTILIADLIKTVFDKWDCDVLVLSHVKEILEQNEKAIRDYTGIDVGMYSSMIGRKEIKKVTVAGIQSAHRNYDEFKHFKLVIIDEAHRVIPSDETMYGRFFKAIGHHVRIGYTATPFRLGAGYIYGSDNSTLFDNVCYDWTRIERFNELIDNGYLSQLTAKRTELEMNTSGIKFIGGDYSDKDLSNEFDRTPVTESAIKEILSAGKDRKAWIVFAIDIAHAEHIAECLIRNGIPTAIVHSKMGDAGFDRDRTIKGIRSGKYRCVVNVDILTTGYDDPRVDLIACLRPTQSPVLHVQSLGRGSRVHPGKKNCLVLDFAGNLSRLGPVNDVLVKKKGKGGKGDPILKTCHGCEAQIATAIRVCPYCDYKFKFHHGLYAAAIIAEIIESGKPRWIDVDSVSYSLSEKAIGPNTAIVKYHAQGEIIKEWVCVEHKGFAKHKADHWVKFRGGKPTNSAKELVESSEDLKRPTAILVNKKDKYFVISDARF